MMAEDDEVQQRTCRACNERYPYPVRKGSATRFYCAACVELSPPVRAAFERFNKRIKALSAGVRKLEQSADKGPAGSG